MIRLKDISAKGAERLREAIENGEFEERLGRPLKPGEILFCDDQAIRDVDNVEMSLKEIREELLHRQSLEADRVEKTEVRLETHETKLQGTMHKLLLFHVALVAIIPAYQKL